MNVGDWTREGLRVTSGRVLFSLTQSLRPVTQVVVFFDGVEIDRLTGNDLRKVAGTYFTLPLRPGSYRLAVSAFSDTGCEDGATRPMTVIVN